MIFLMVFEKKIIDKGKSFITLSTDKKSCSFGKFIIFFNMFLGIIGIEIDIIEVLDEIFSKKHGSIYPNSSILSQKSHSDNIGKMSQSDPFILHFF